MKTNDEIESLRQELAEAKAKIDTLKAETDRLRQVAGNECREHTSREDRLRAAIVEFARGGCTNL